MTHPAPVDLPEGDLTVRLASLHLYPVKSCGGVHISEGLLVETGLELDRAWMVVDAERRFVTQRELPRMALIQPTVKHAEVVLRAPGMLALHLAVDTVEEPMRVTVWDDEVAAYDMGDLAAQWVSDFLAGPPPPGADAQRAASIVFPLRLVRFDPDQKRLSNRRWTGDIEAENAFSDGYPLSVVSEGSLDELNRRLAERGVDAVTAARFRPNLVLAGLDANDEDHLDEICFAGDEGLIRIKLVKPCPRCPIPNIDPATGASSHEPGDTMASYRASAKLDGAISFAMNAVIVEGIDCALRVGMVGSATYAFD